MIASCAEWLTAVGTLLIAVLAVFLALFGQHIRALICRPKLTLEEPEEKGHFTFSGDKKIWYCHLSLRNASRWAAKNCRVLLREAYRRGPDGRYDKPIPLYATPQFQWSFPGITPMTPTVVKDKRVDLGCLVQGDTLFRPSLYWWPVYFNGNVAAGESVRYVVEIEAEGLIIRPDSVVIEVSWDGQWSDETEKMREHLTVVWNPPNG